MDYFNCVNAKKCLNGLYPNYMSYILHNSKDYD